MKSLPPVVDKDRFVRAAEAAYDLVSAYMAQFPERCRPGYWLFDYAEQEMRDLTKVYQESIGFAHFCGVRHVMHAELIGGHASWLIKRRKFAIAIDISMLSQWKDLTKVPKRVQAARCVLHELGHVQLQSDRLQGAAGHLIASVKPEDEAEAWVFAFSAFALIVGDYSSIVRCGGRGFLTGKDDAPAATV